MFENLSGSQCVLATASRRPLALSRAAIDASTERSPTGRRGLGSSSVSGRSRWPKPAHRTIVWLRLGRAEEGEADAGIDCGYVPQDVAWSNPALGTRAASPGCVTATLGVEAAV